jgi:hypothetical protein
MATPSLAHVSALALYKSPINQYHWVLSGHDIADIIVGQAEGDGRFPEPGGLQKP